MPPPRYRMAVWPLACAAVLAVVAGSLRADEPLPEVRSARSLVVGLEIDRYGSRIVAYALKDRPFVAPPDAKAAVYADGERVEIEVELLAGKKSLIRRRVDAGPICLLHDAASEPHVEGDTIRLHRDAVVFELPEMAEADAIEVAWYDGSKSASARRVVGRHAFDPEAFTAAGGDHRYADLHFADPAATADPSHKSARKAGGVWPEDLGDSQVYRTWGDPADPGRIHITLVPDGYTYAEKAVMETHAAGLVQAFRNKSPWRELDPYINYTLVYAYSAESGTDQCDCGSLRDTAMGTRFPAAGDACGGAGNRCLYYGSACDTANTGNIIAAELRAPAHDVTVLMVNTTRYGGCGGVRAVVAAGNASGAEVAIHELGHTLANLADEYGGGSACGGYGGEINVSTQATSGAWPEWIGAIGAPRRGGRYYDNCLFRPTDDCAMRTLHQPFCPVCSQRLALVVLGHPRVAPTAPLRSVTPPSPHVAWMGIETEFRANLRLPVGTLNPLVWTVLRPSSPEPETLPQTGSTLRIAFDEPGDHRVTARVTAARNLIRPERDGPNVESRTVEVEVLAPISPPEISSPGATSPLRLTSASRLTWEDTAFAGVVAYNLYRGLLGTFAPGPWGDCLTWGQVVPWADDPQVPPAGQAFGYLVTGTNSLGEGPAGLGAGGAERVLGNACPD